MSEICVFDLDGTLVDSMSYFAAGLLKILDEAGIPYDDGIVETITPLGYVASAELFRSMGVEATVEEMVAQMKENLVYEYSNNIKLKPYVGDFLRQLKAQGARLFVLTASPHVVTDICLKNNGVYDLFEQIWSVDDFGMTKSELELFDAVAQKIGCKPQDINYFEDNLTAVTNAALSQYKVYGVLDKQQPEDIEQIKELSDIFVHSYKDLLD